MTKYCINCAEELIPAIDNDPNGDENCVCTRCKAEDNHDFEKYPNVRFDRYGNQTEIQANKLYITVGYPRSGKSTWAKTQNCPVVNPDSIRLAIHGQPFIASAEPYVWAVAKTMVKSLFIAGHNKVILDATNITEKARDNWKSNDWQRIFVLFNTNKETCIQRARKTTFGNHQTELVKAIELMQFEPITLEEQRLDNLAIIDIQ